MKVLIVGAGNMGLTYAQGFLNANIISPSNLFFIDRGQRRSAEMERLSRNLLFEAPDEFVREMDLIVLSVKPQDFHELADELSVYTGEDQLILSIMAGTSIETIRESLGTNKIIRAMPNLPAQVGQGMTVFTTTSDVSRSELLAVHNLLNTTGKTLYTDNELMIDAATAISGSGPGYVFFIMNGMIEAAKQMGFSDAEAQLLVRQTFLGSIDLLNQDELQCGEWVAKVASKGGTTEAALRAFENGDLIPALESGLVAAYERARELSEQEIS